MAETTNQKLTPPPSGLFILGLVIVLARSAFYYALVYTTCLAAVLGVQYIRVPETVKLRFFNLPSNYYSAAYYFSAFVLGMLLVVIVAVKSGIFDRKREKDLTDGPQKEKGEK